MPVNNGLNANNKVIYIHKFMPFQFGVSIDAIQSKYNQPFLPTFSSIYNENECRKIWLYITDR